MSKLLPNQKKHLKRDLSRHLPLVLNPTPLEIALAAPETPGKLWGCAGLAETGRRWGTGAWEAAVGATIMRTRVSSAWGSEAW
eukprot:738443-Amorphochlora_amoeboformis.AAC.1